jgi:hypothetical protein
MGKRKTRRFELHLFPGRGLAGMSSMTLSLFPSLVNAPALQLSGSNGPANDCETLYFWLDTAALSETNRLYSSG